MSAFFVGEPHINALLTWTKVAGLGLPVPDPRISRDHGGAIGSSYMDRDLSIAIGRELAGENVASLQARYSQGWGDMLPDGFEVMAYRPVPDHHWLQPPHRAVRALKLIDCYEYQSCEHKGWHTSFAHDFCDWLRGVSIDKLPGYDDAAWSYDGPPAALPAGDRAALGRPVNGGGAVRHIGQG